MIVFGRASLMGCENVRIDRLIKIITLLPLNKTNNFKFFFKTSVI
jgi:hypothetical protein